MQKPHASPPIDEDQEPKDRIKELEAQLLLAEIEAEAYDKKINEAEAKFKMPIRKNWRQTVDNLHAKDRGRYRTRTFCGLFGGTRQAFYQYDDAALAKPTERSSPCNTSRTYTGSTRAWEYQRYGPCISGSSDSTPR